MGGIDGMTIGRGLRFGVLGHLEITRDAAPVTIASRKQRIALATLLLRANQLVTKDELMDRIWESELPLDVLASLHTHMSRLRRTLGGEAGMITRRDSGYTVPATEETLDLLRFRHLTTLAAATRARGDAVGEARLLREALTLWRGPALADVGSESLQRDVAPVLERERMRTQERWFEVEIGRGEPAEVITDLETAVLAHPTHERFWAQLVRAHTQAGRPAEALETYATARRALSTELGVDPGPELRQARQRIPRKDVPSAPSRTGGGVPTPAELPAGTGAFTGRTAELAHLRTHLTSGRPRPFAAIVGTGGVGKSALAVHAAHQVAGHFPDGQLYVDLYGATPGLRPLSPLEVLGRFLRSCGFAATAVPASVDEAAARFRSATYDSRMLVVLDNASDAAQVRPLIPGGTGCGVIVTCRRSLVPLAGAHQSRLGALPEDEARLLLSRLVGPERVDAEPEAVRDVLLLCGGLPLRLSVVAARLAARPAETFGVTRERLAMEQGRLTASAAR
ncbi:BTAD domain-containing putative transcriptional regulator [Nonomuraea sp. NPDC050643]|uniref:AfsR/SARP family transcriptional regulator n=1 Tax=Nonomuraea sp. NPDC050643 TaxID=3155660 RepID=UPI0033CAFE68